MKVAVLVAAHNRRAATLRVLRSLSRQWPTDHQLRVVLVDDGSTDGTGDAVRDEFPNTHVVTAGGDLFWCKSMALAWDTAVELDDFDGFLWLNDDVALDDDAIARLLVVASVRANARRPAVLVGATRDPDTGLTTYGGLVLASCWHPGKHRRVEPDGTLRPVDTFNGNFTYVPAEVERQIGRISNRFTHATGDTEYGLRARKAGVPVLLLAEHIGACRRGAPVVHTVRSFLGPKGLPWRDWLHVTRRYTRFGLWPVAFAGPYARMFMAQHRRRLSALRTPRSGRVD